MSVTETSQWPGERFGAAESGAGSVASMGSRMGAFLIDIGLSAAAALAVTYPELPKNLSLVIWFAVTIATVALFGATPGQWLLGIRVAKVRGSAFVGAWAVLRTALIFLIVPPLVSDADGRGWHDKACRTIVLRTR